MNTAKDELLTIDRAVKFLKTSRPTFYRLIKAKEVNGVRVGKQWRFYRSELERCIKGDQAPVNISGDIYSFVTELEKIAKKRKLSFERKDFSNDLDLSIFLMMLLADSYSATNIFLDVSINAGNNNGSKANSEDLLSEKFSMFRLRVHQEVVLVTKFDAKLHALFVARLKDMCKCDQSVTDRPQNGRMVIQINKKLDLLLSFTPALLGESISIQRIDKSTIAQTFSISNLKLSSKILDNLKNVLNLKTGLIVVSGPTNSGITTTMYNLIGEVAGLDKKVVTLESPVECVIPFASQTQIQIPKQVQLENVNMSSFDPANLLSEMQVKYLKSIMRTMPDILMLGDLKNKVLSSDHLFAAASDTLVVANIQGYSAIDVLLNILHIVKNSETLSFISIVESLKLITSQKLFRELCPYCRSTVETKMLASQMGFFKIKNSVKKLYHAGQGCERCLNGYKNDQILVLESLVITNSIKNLIIKFFDSKEQITKNDFLITAKNEGMIPLLDISMQLLLEGKISVHEFLKKFENF